MRYTRLFIFVFSIVVIASCDKKTSWYENYQEKSTEPFGTYILFNESQDLFDGKEVIRLKQNLHDYLNDTYFEEDYTFNYICVKQNANKITQSGIEELLLYVESGSHVFFALNNFSRQLEETLGFKTLNADFRYFSAAHLKKLKGSLVLSNEDFDQREFDYDRNLRRHYFSSYDEKNTIVLGTQKMEGEDKPVFIKVYYGKGAIYLHTQPIAFTNYNLLNENYEYAEKVLSYLPDDDILWDPQIRGSRIDENSEEGSSESIFSFFWKHPPLKWALNLGFIGLLTFMFFNARRKQRPVPIIEPPKNSTVEFTHTISNLYLLNEDHTNLVRKKIQFFLEKVRTRYYLDTQNLNTEFIEKLALKSGNDLQKTKYLINSILVLHKKEDCSPEELMSLNKMIDNFLKRK